MKANSLDSLPTGSPAPSSVQKTVPELECLAVKQMRFYRQVTAALRKISANEEYIVGISSVEYALEALEAQTKAIADSNRYCRTCGQKLP